MGAARVSFKATATTPAVITLVTASRINSHKYDRAASRPPIIGPKVTARLATTRKIPKPWARFSSVSKSATIACWAGKPTSASRPTTTVTSTKGRKLSVNPISRADKALITRPKIRIPLRPIRSVKAPPSTLLIRLVPANTPNRIPTSVIPTPNFLVMYREKKGKSSAPPRRSINIDPTRIQNWRGYSLNRDRTLRQRPASPEFTGPLMQFSQEISFWLYSRRQASFFGCLGYSLLFHREFPNDPSIFTMLKP